MSTPVASVLLSLIVIAAVYFLFVVPGERRYHETKLRLMQERIERRQHGDGKDRRETREDDDEVSAA